MSIKMAALSGRTETTTFTFQDEPVTISYRPNYMTPERQSVMATATEAQAATDGFVDLVVGMIVSWDVLDEQDQPIAVTPEFVQQLPYSFLAAAVMAAGEAMQPGEAARP